MSRTGEIVLGIISALFSLGSIILLSIVVINGSSATQEEGFATEVEQIIMSDPNLTSQDAELFIENLDPIINFFSILGWGFVIVLVISLVLNILGIVFVMKNKKPKLAGIMFIVAGLFAGIISITSILLYIAAIMCFVRKSPVQIEEQEYYSPKQPM